LGLGSIVNWMEADLNVSLSWF